MLTGIEKFKGRYLHSRDYKDAQAFTDKRVVVIGIGNSGSDLAVEISQTAQQVSRSRVLVGRTAPVGHCQLHRDTRTKALHSCCSVPALAVVGSAGSCQSHLSGN